MIEVALVAVMLVAAYTILDIVVEGVADLIERIRLWIRYR